MGQLDGKVTILTGAGTGIGKGMARAFAREGAPLILASRNRANLEETAAEIAHHGVKVLVVPTDVTDEGQVAALYNTTKHGLVGLTKSIALEGRDYNVVCSALHPGNVMTERRAASSKPQDAEPMMTVDELALTAVTMAALPLHVNVLEAIVLPTQQAYLGRG